MAGNQEEKYAYYLRLVSMFIDIGTTTVVSAFIHHSPDNDADTFLAGKIQELRKLERNKILSKHECELVFTPPYNVNNLDISLLIKLMINLFSKEQLTPPTRGWNNPPRNPDKSIAADLLRLRKIRNEIVGHRSEAVLPKWHFDNVWEKVQQILLRIQHGICPGDEDRLKRRIEDYKLQTLDPCVQNRHANILRGWHDEISELQAEVEDLITKLNGMDVYLKHKSDQYERYIILLVKGGRLVLSNFLEHELKRQKKDLRQVIQDKESFFKNNITNNGHVDTLYPHESNSAQQFDTSTWDAMLLAVVLLQVIDCNCENETKLAIESISNAEKNYADAVILSLNSDDFSDYVVDLKYSIIVLSRFLENDKKSEIEKILEECKSNSQNSQIPQACFEELNTRGIQLKSTFADTLKKTKDHLQQMITHRIDFKNEHVPDEIRLDPYALELYETALRDGKEIDRSIRINIVGNYKQGKTSLARRIIGHEIDTVESTNGIEVEHYTYQKTPDGIRTYSNANESDYVERLLSIIHTMVEPIIDTYPSKRVLPTTSEQTQTTVDRPDLDAGSHHILQSKAAQTNTNDETLNTEHDDRMKASLFSEEDKVRYAKEVERDKATDSKQDSKASLDIWDFGGQCIFYATHTVFHSKRAIYLLVFDLSQPLCATVQDEDITAFSSPDRNTEYFLRFWMNSIHSFVGSDDWKDPPVFLVGTNRDKLEGDAIDQRTYIENYFDEVWKLFDGTRLIDHIHDEDFSVDNTIANDDVVVPLLEAIIRVGNERSCAFEIPAKWILLEKSLNAKRHLKIISFQLVSEIDAENEFPLGVEQIKLFLQYHHAKGTYMYFDENLLSEYVILDPKYLIDAFKSIITSVRFCRNKPEIRLLRQALEREAKLDHKLIDALWSEDDSYMFMQNKDILLSFLLKHHIISEATTYDESTQKQERLGWYVVPSLLKSKPEQKHICQFLQGKLRTQLRFVMLFCDSSIVRIVYHRLLAATISRWSIAAFVGVPFVFEHLYVVRLNEDHAGIAEMKNDTIELSVVNLCPKVCVDPEQVDIFRRFSEAIIGHEFRKLCRREELHAKPYSIRYRCNHETHGKDGSLEIIEIDASHDRKKLVPCPDLVTHTDTIYPGKAILEWYQDDRKPLVVPHIQVDDRLLSRISKYIGNNWELLGCELGLSQVQIEHIKADHPCGTLLKIYHMLRSACTIMSDSASMNSLVQAMQRCPSVTIEWDGIRNIVDDIVP